jgi:hypothetical protein
MRGDTPKNFAMKDPHYKTSGEEDEKRSPKRAEEKTKILHLKMVRKLQVFREQIQHGQKIKN